MNIALTAEEEDLETYFPQMVCCNCSLCGVTLQSAYQPHRPRPGWPKYRACPVPETVAGKIHGRPVCAGCMGGSLGFKQGVGGGRRRPSTIREPEETRLIEVT